MIAVPGDLAYEVVINNLPPPPGWRSHEAHGEVGLIQDLETGLWRPATQAEFFQALYEQGELYESDEDDGEICL